MKKIIFAIIILIFSCSVAQSQKSGFGAGLIIGEPTGLSFKSWLSSNTAIDAAAGWSFVNSSSLHIHADYLLHTNSLITSGPGSLPFYYGIGGRIKFSGNNGSSKDTRLGVRIPLGLVYQFSTAPVDIFLEVVPVLDLSPLTEFTINSGLGARYYFK
jgi:hypothetical protein